MKAIIPAAGYATRMYPLTKDKPKGLLPVAGKPMIEHVIAKLCEIKEINKIVVVTNSKFFANFFDWSNGFESAIPIKILDDGTTSNETRLGSIGDIKFAIEKENINDDIIIVNSDNLFTFSLTKMVSFFREKNAPIIGVFDTKSIEQAKKMGVPELDANSKVIGFVEKPENPTTTVCSVGIYIYPKSVVPKFKEYLSQGNSPDKTGEFVDWLYKRETVFGFVFNAPKDKWFDIGSLEMYEKVKNGF